MSGEISEIKVTALTHIHTHRRGNKRECSVIFSIAGIMKLLVKHKAITKLMWRNRSDWFMKNIFRESTWTSMKTLHIFTSHCAATNTIDVRNNIQHGNINHQTLTTYY